MSEGVSNVAKAAASTINWLPIGIGISIVAILAMIIVATTGFLASQHANLSDQHYDLNRDVGVVIERVNGLVDSHKELNAE